MLVAAHLLASVHEESLEQNEKRGEVKVEAVEWKKIEMEKR